MERIKIENGKIAVVKHHAFIREYYNPVFLPENTEGITREYYLTDTEWKEWSEQQIPKHKRYELVSHEDIDVSAYAWVDGVDVLGEADPMFTANEMIKYTSREEYEVAQPAQQAEYQIDLDYRLSKLELGI